MIYDATRHRIIVSGGFLDIDQNNLSSETWALPTVGTQIWTKLTTSAVSANDGSGIYDPIRDRMVVFDGVHVTALQLDTPSSWTTVATTGTAPAGGGHLVYNPTGDRMIVLLPGGNAYALSFAGGTPAWNHLATTGSGSGGTSAAVMLDPVRNRLFACAGGTFNVGVGVWELPLGTLAWHKLSFSGLQPAVRVFASAIYDVADDQAITYGGTNQGVYLSPPGPWQMSATRPLAVPGAPAGGRELSLRVGPQPSHGVTTISFELPSAGETRLDVFDVNGRCVKTLIAWPLTAGRHDATWAAAKGAGGPNAGVYFVRLQHGPLAASRKLVLSQ